MQRIPIEIRDIVHSTTSDVAIVAKFVYSLPAGGIESGDETVQFDQQYYFEGIIGAEFGRSEINEWVRTHGGNWSAARFLFDKIMDRGGLLPLPD